MSLRRIAPRTYKALHITRAAISTGRSIAKHIKRPKKQNSRELSKRIQTSRRPSTLSKRPSGLYMDPARLPRPIDLPGYDNNTAVRLVPFFKGNKRYMPVRGLVEGQISQPQHQFIKALMLFNGHPEYGDIEFTDENGDGYIDRWIRRGVKTAKSGRNLNLFVDIEPASKDERLKVENWKLVEE